MPKKKKEMTDEERLQAALVPKEEWPYELPEGWKWVYLGKITSVVGGGTPSSAHPEYYENGNIPWISPADLSTYQEIYIEHGRKYITEKGLEKSSTKLLPINTVMLSSRAPIGYVVIAANPICTNQGFKNFLPTKNINPRYLYWFLKGNKALLESYASGTTFLELSAKRAGEIKFPLASLQEQKDLVDIIEKLFMNLDKAQQKVQHVLDSFEARKAALLHAAFTGELTAKWRREHKNIPWNNKFVREICNDIKVGIVIKPSQYYTDKEHGIPAFRSANVREFHIDSKEWVYINDIGQENNKRSIVHEGDVLVVRSGNPGTSCVVSKECDGYGAIDILIAVPNQDIVLPEFLCAYTNSSISKNYIEENKRGMALTHFNVKRYANLPIKIPPIDEQGEIIRLLNNFFCKEKKAKTHIKQILLEITRMKQSILARAFRGELNVTK